MKLRFQALYIVLIFSASVPAVFAVNDFTLQSSAFAPNAMIPEQFTCGGEGKSPPVSWENIPPKTQSIALTMVDPEASNGNTTHWIVYNIPISIHAVEQNPKAPKSSEIGKNSWNETNYHAPCPEFGAHQYVFKIYALDSFLNIPKDANTDAILQAMTGHVIGSAELVGLFQKL